MGFYSNKVKSVADIPEGAVISVPNDPTNCGRGLLLLQAAGLIKLPEGMGSEASLADIVENKRNLKIRELEAAQLPRSLDDALVAVIPMNYVISAGLSPQKQASTSSPSRRRSRSSSSPRIRTAGTTRAFRLRQVLPLARSQGLRRKDLQRHDQAELVITAFCA